MRVLAIETASEACSVALFEGAGLVAHEHRVLGRGHAEALVPMIAQLPDKGRADRILVSLGPGSFTGVRIGIAAGRALGVAWGAQVLGYPTLALIAAIARQDAAAPSGEITVCTHGGHGEWFVQNFDAAGLPSDALTSLTPDAAAQRPVGAVIAGNRSGELAVLLKSKQHQALNILPDAARLMHLPTALLTPHLSPNYGRAPDAKPQGSARPAKSSA